MMLLPSIVSAAAMLSVASSAAVPTGCAATYIPESGDSCTSIVAKYGNCELQVQCWGLGAGRPVCINLPPNQGSAPYTAGVILAASQDPVPQAFGIVSGCKYFQFTDNNGTPGLAQILKANNITVDQWNAWNWSLEPSQHNNVWANYFSCVAV